MNILLLVVYMFNYSIGVNNKLINQYILFLKKKES
jgi:hypothetical protein